MIYSSLPPDWHDLQDKVAEVFREIGFETEVEKDLKLARGSANIDVYAEDQTQSPNLIYLCECKYWDKPVPQSVVHAFRSVVTDSGANYGLMISKLGFQSGGFSASEYTNIELLDWLQFQELLEDRWIRDYMIPQIREENWALMSYIPTAFLEIIHGLYEEIERATDPEEIESLERQLHLLTCNPASGHGLFDEESRLKYEQLYVLYFGIAVLTNYLSMEAFRPRLPLQKATISCSQVAQVFHLLPHDLTKITALRDFLTAVIYYCRQGVQHFNELVQNRVE